MFKTGIKTALLAAALISGGAAQATVILFSNFDNVITPAPTGRSTSTVQFADGWTATSTLGIELQFNNAAGAPKSGIALVELDTTANSGMFYPLARGHYDVSYWYSPRQRVAALSNGISLSIGTRLLDSIALKGGSTTNWQLRTVQFFTPGGPLTFAATGKGDKLGGYLDDITIRSIAVPEPASWAMLIVGFGLIGASARRRRASQLPSVLA